ncbi:hypothetical protein HYS91_05065 [Candidatus Daviesbacteria bacterium]|nr:hypothetical protein [Candidatus Daviesbacteria bacterium]
MKPAKLLNLSFLKIFQIKVRLPFTMLLATIAFLVGVLINNFSTLGNIEKISLNKQYSIGDIKIKISEAQLTETIRLSGKSSKAPQNKKFLVIFSESFNASTSAMQIPYGNWFRVEEEKRKLAPLPLNSSFTNPPQATLEKQLVFIVDKAKDKFNLLVGELDKKPANIEIKF